MKAPFHPFVSVRGTHDIYLYGDLVKAESFVYIELTTDLIMKDGRSFVYSMTINAGSWRICV